jgi:hypothetical protein
MKAIDAALICGALPFLLLTDKSRTVQNRNFSLHFRLIYSVFTGQDPLSIRALGQFRQNVPQGID